MRNLIFILLLFSATGSFSFELEINWRFVGIQEDYNHNNKIEVYLDDQLVATSAVYLQSAMGAVTIAVPEGKHALKLVDFVYFEGQWEAHAAANDYSVDAVVNEEIELRSDSRMKVVFDIGEEAVSAKVSEKKRKKDRVNAEAGTGIPFSVSWEYRNIVEGYDHANRMAIYIDGKRALESQALRESVAGEVTFQLPKGKHDLLFTTEVFYDGKWEEQAKANNYSFDGFYAIDRLSAKKSMQLSLVFDIQQGSTTATLVKRGKYLGSTKSVSK